MTTTLVPASTPKVEREINVQYTLNHWPSTAAVILDTLAKVATGQEDADMLYWLKNTPKGEDHDA